MRSFPLSAKVSERPLKPLDLQRLKRPINESLKGVFPAQEVVFFPLEKKKDFSFDPLTKEAWIPLSLDGVFLGTLYLRKIDPGVLGPELKRWAPLMAHLLWDRTWVLRKSLLDEDGLPNLSFLEMELKDEDRKLELLIYPAGLAPPREPCFYVFNHLRATVGEGLNDVAEELAGLLWRKGLRGPVIYVQKPAPELVTEALLLLDLARTLGFTFLKDRTAEEFLQRFGLKGFSPPRKPLPREGTILVSSDPLPQGVYPLFEGQTKIGLSSLGPEEILSNKPKGTLGLVRIGESLSPTRSLIGAIFAFEHARLLGPEKTVVFDDLSCQVGGDVYLSLGDRGGAIWAYREALRINPRNVDAANSLATVLAEVGRPRAAARVFKKARKIRPDDHLLHYNLGLLYMGLGRNKEAIDHLERALTLNRDNFQILLALARCLLREKRYHEAAERLEAVAEEAKDLKGYWGLLGESLFLAGRLKEAAKALGEAVRQRPEDARSLSYLGLVFIETEGDPEIGLSLCRQALELRPKSSVVQRNYQAALELVRQEGLPEELVE